MSLYLFFYKRLDQPSQEKKKSVLPFQSNASSVLPRVCLNHSWLTVFTTYPHMLHWFYIYSKWEKHNRLETETTIRASCKTTLSLYRILDYNLLKLYEFTHKKTWCTQVCLPVQSVDYTVVHVVIAAISIFPIILSFLLHTSNKFQVTGAKIKRENIMWSVNLVRLKVLCVKP